VASPDGRLNRLGTHREAGWSEALETRTSLPRRWTVVVLVARSEGGLATRASIKQDSGQLPAHTHALIACARAPRAKRGWPFGVWLGEHEA
jgi:hypothetical protein